MEHLESPLTSVVTLEIPVVLSKKPFPSKAKLRFSGRGSFGYPGTRQSSGVEGCCDWHVAYESPDSF